MPRRASKKAPVVLPPDEWMSAREVARELGIARPTVAQFALRGRLIYQHAAGRTVYSRESVAKLADEMDRKTA